jgi:carotenoid 1,2-hydratase
MDFPDDRPSSENHVWNLVAPKAQFEGQILVSEKTNLKLHWPINSPGYHDHNHGSEPMKDTFRDWIWGRFHLERETLVYYGFRYQDSWQMNSWLISDDGKNLIHSTDMKYSRLQFPNIFGLSFPRVQRLEIAKRKFEILHTDIVDSGPFYIRSYPELREIGVGDVIRGFGEYIRPQRIYSKVFWPLVDMRIRYDAEQPHWVQRSPLLFPVTW